MCRVSARVAERGSASAGKCREMSGGVVGARACVVLGVRGATDASTVITTRRDAIPQGKWKTMEKRHMDNSVLTFMIQ